MAKWLNEPFAYTFLCVNLMPEKNQVAPPKWILPTIVLAQFCCTSLWFAGNAVVDDLVGTFGLPSSALGSLTSAVQFGFIIGTLVFAFFTVADRFSPSKVFMVCALLGAATNLGVGWEGNGFFSLLSLRFSTGFFLAGIYPVGMKIASDYYQKGLGKSLGFLVGALVLGTAFPHLLKGNLLGIWPWQWVIYITSGIASIGGILVMLLVPDGPFRKAAQKLDPSALVKVFRNRQFRTAAFGYFGHMWELYTFWALVPIILKQYFTSNQLDLNVPVWSFSIIALGSLSCILGGYLSARFGPKKIAFFALLLSCISCLILPALLAISVSGIFLPFMFIWGAVVIPDSPLFSTLVAQNVRPDWKATALTIVNSIGFTITIVSILFISYLLENTSSNWVYALLALGPFVGLAQMLKDRGSSEAN